MTRLLKAIVVVTVMGAALLGLSSAADAADVGGYTPDQCTEVIGGVETVVPCDPDVLGTVQYPAAVASAEVASASGTLPYTGNDSTLPLAEIGVGLLAAGGLVLLVVKSRRLGSA
jgi:LPXTG-motif cell wall-anchored protein